MFARTYWSKDGQRQILTFYKDNEATLSVDITGARPREIEQIFEKCAEEYGIKITSKTVPVKRG